MFPFNLLRRRPRKPTPTLSEIKALSPVNSDRVLFAYTLRELATRGEKLCRPECARAWADEVVGREPRNRAYDREAFGIWYELEPDCFTCLGRVQAVTFPPIINFPTVWSGRLFESVPLKFEVYFTDLKVGEGVLAYFDRVHNLLARPLTAVEASFFRRRLRLRFDEFQIEFGDTNLDEWDGFALSTEPSGAGAPTRFKIAIPNYTYRLSRGHEEAAYVART